MGWSRGATFTAVVALASLVLGALALPSCIGDLTGGEPGVDAGPTPDAGSDAPPPPPGGFALSLSLQHVTADPGDPPTAVTVTVRRAPDFGERVAVEVKGGVVGAAASVPPDVEPTSDRTSFTVGVDAAAVARGEQELVVRGTSPTGKTATATLGLRIGSVLPADAKGEIVVPAYATQIVVAAWGGGGGSGPALANTLSFPGGSGAFASGRFTVAPGATLVVEVGGGGRGGASYGGGGGGYSGVRLGPQYLLVVGGGGGGGGADLSASSGAGGAGGAAKGGQTGGGPCPGHGASDTASGAGGSCGPGKVGAPGAALQGGDGYNAKSAPRAAFGGGAGGALGPAYCGGGGGGAFGGGGGGCDASSGGGGGGSTVVSPLAVDVVRDSTNSTPAPRTDHPDYASGVAVGGVVDLNSAPLSNGGPGRVVVRLAKP